MKGLIKFLYRVLLFCVGMYFVLILLGEPCSSDLSMLYFLLLKCISMLVIYLCVRLWFASMSKEERDELFN